VFDAPYLLAAPGPGAAGRLEAERRRLSYDSIPGTGVAGDVRAVAEAVKRWADAGADTVVLQPTVDDPDAEGFVRFVAGEVAPLLGEQARPPGSMRTEEAW
jgi:alkanesulfonate monooxygenase SsuD/methylene tetrahydromethanopterin reductase-like flavin-dependent oxidoreductase (luciferase family)